jgi:hypothetical protein
MKNKKAFQNDNNELFLKVKKQLYKQNNLIFLIYLYNFIKTFLIENITIIM